MKFPYKCHSDASKDTHNNNGTDSTKMKVKNDKMSPEVVKETEIKNDSPLKAVTRILLTNGSYGLDGAFVEHPTSGFTHR